MKRMLLMSLALIFSAMIFAQQTGPAISWTSNSHDFGVVTEDGGPQEWSFEFVNTGNEPLVLQSVKPSCGCTSADWSKEPIQPGQKGFVKASYNPKGRGTGRFNKSITVTTNETQPVSYLRIEGEVPTVATPTNQDNTTVAPERSSLTPDKPNLVPAQEQKTVDADRTQIKTTNQQEKTK
ncbi:MAG: DUF1573 domain-containing protein [Bacteroidales bacterium]|jgi:hypothetical protein|nr:DUF1573 domain-containing protein [Bacteroidales bacterium]